MVMNSRYIEESVKRKLYAESMGRCMNPNCQKELFRHNGDISEKAHIIPYCNTADNSFENLVLLCPNCHTEFDKNHAFTPEEVLEWKRIRNEEVKKFFCKKYDTFAELQKKVVPMLWQNKLIYEKYYLNEHRILWDRFEDIVLVNNRKLKNLFLTNLDLFQRHLEPSYSNLQYIESFIAHVNEFEMTRLDKEKCRKILFPAEVDSMFGIAPIQKNLIPLVEPLEVLISKLKSQGKFEKIIIGVTEPYIQMNENGKSVQVFLDDAPRLRQLYNDYNCFRKSTVRLESLNYALKYIRSRHISYHFAYEGNLKEIIIKNIKMTFVYKYCFSESDLRELAPEKGSVIINLHNWNGESCISTQAYKLAKHMEVELLPMDEFYGANLQYKCNTYKK